MLRVRHASLLAVAALAITSVGTAPAAEAAVPVGSRTVFVGNYNTGDFCQWGNIQNKVRNGTACGYDQSFYGAKVLASGDHPTAARYELRNGDFPDVPGGERSEARAGSAADVVEGDERWYQFSLKFGDTFPNPTGSYFIVMQWHPVDASPVPLSVEVNPSGNLVLRTDGPDGVTKTIGPVQRGTWVDYVVHARFSDDPDVGFAEVSRNGSLVVGKHSRRMMPSASNYLKQGAYRDKVDSATAVVWHDGLRVTAP